METYLPNSIKEVSPSAPKTEGTNIFDNYSVELTKKTTSGPSQIKIAMSEIGITTHSSTLTQVSKGHLQKLLDIKKIRPDG